MPDTKISALPAAATLGDTDELVLAVAGANQKLTGANLKASVAGIGPEGPEGPQGDQGIQGIQGPRAHPAFPARSSPCRR